MNAQISCFQAQFKYKCFFSTPNAFIQFLKTEVNSKLFMGLLFGEKNTQRI